MFILGFFAELLLLFFASRILTQELSQFFYRVTHSKKVSIYFLAFIFLPGTFIHEASHALSAIVLFVKVHNFELMPQLSGDSLKLGSVEISKTDIVRNFFIGVAPFIVGTSAILASLIFLTKYGVSHNLIITAVVGYVVFVVGNTMFSSRKDMDGALEFFGFIILPIAVLFFLGVKTSFFNLNFLDSSAVVNVFRTGCYFLFAPLLLDGILISTIKFFNK